MHILHDWELIEIVEKPTDYYFAIGEAKIYVTEGLSITTQTLRCRICGKRKIDSEWASIKGEFELIPRAKQEQPK